VRPPVATDHCSQGSGTSAAPHCCLKRCVPLPGVQRPKSKKKHPARRAVTCSRNDQYRSMLARAGLAHAGMTPTSSRTRRATEPASRRDWVRPRYTTPNTATSERRSRSVRRSGAARPAAERPHVAREHLVRTRPPGRPEAHLEALLLGAPDLAPQLGSSPPHASGASGRSSRSVILRSDTRSGAESGRRVRSSSKSTRNLRASPPRAPRAPRPHRWAHGSTGVRNGIETEVVAEQATPDPTRAARRATRRQDRGPQKEAIVPQDVRHDSAPTGQVAKSCSRGGKRRTRSTLRRYHRGR